jgi:hypothetical protein
MKAKKWEVFAKPFAEPLLVYEYLSRYVHQVATSNYRIVKIEQGQVHFEYHDNKDEGQTLAVLTLKPEDIRWDNGKSCTSAAKPPLKALSKNIFWIIATSRFKAPSTQPAPFFPMKL